MKPIQPVILSGGAGTRLWPLSREYYPKQLLTLSGDNSLLQDTLTRLNGIDSCCAQGLAVLPALIVCNEEHRFLVAEQARQVGSAVSAIILEPVGRNTAPALTLAALHITAAGHDSVMMVMPADHVITQQPAFHDAVCQALTLAGQGYLVTFGIVPRRAETGYGYIRKGQALPGSTGFALERFVEKPDAATATQYLQSGDYLWNSGMFMMQASLWLQAMQQLQPAMYQACLHSYQHGSPDRDFYRLDNEQFRACHSDSIDYAVMEKISAGSGAGLRSCVIPLAAGWSDIGSFPALWEVGAADAQGNVTRGDVYAHDSRNSLLLADSRLLAAIGIQDTIVIETADAVLVVHKDHAQDVKKIVERIKNDARTEHQTHRRVFRPWGYYEGVDSGPGFQVKRITVHPGSRLSLQMHHHRAEHWVVVRGTARVTRGSEVFLLTENQSTYIPVGETHRLENPGTVALEIIEVQSGSYLGEDDIVRFDDMYGRKD
ncbi:MAG: mannose-1-phosphate guanylyltransferase/mannose-6-phosphate isomerase [Gammaproteobacteria bacterium]|nr:mannose-1-phosphate guanylyltransferase/mannose-6-phosphate isomerase [Gammaproteobacteria bacterium]